MLSKKINEAISIIKKTKISIKLTIVYAFMFSLVLLLLNASILYGVKFYVYSQAEQQVADIQTLMSTKLSKNQYINISDKKILSDIPINKNIFLRIISNKGKIINTTDKFPYTVKKLNINLKNLTDNYDHIEDKERHFLYKSVKFKSDIYGSVYIQIVKDMSNEYDFMEILFAVMAVADFIGIIVSIILGYIISKRMLKRIDDITKTAENISINNLRERIEVKAADDELTRLSKTFNKMIDRLQKSFDKQVQFVADASHELRTPIAVIQGYANLLDRWGKDDRVALEKAIYGIKFESSNIADLIEKLLFIAKNDNNTQIMEKKEFWLNELIDEIVMESRLIEQNHKISCNKNDKIRIVADYKMIKQMLRIFIENSIKFSNDQSTIEISSKKQDDLAEIVIIDQGVGIPKEEIDRIFDRFYIVDKSRSKEKGGTGLGLSIAKQIAYIHNGKIDIESEEGKWTKVIVTLNIL